MRQCAPPHIPAGWQGDWQLLGAVPAVSLLSPPRCAAPGLMWWKPRLGRSGAPLGQLSHWSGTGQGKGKDSLAA